MVALAIDAVFHGYAAFGAEVDAELAPLAFLSVYLYLRHIT
jgi:hypothetical protein